jgi:predicted transcriptional regulator
VPISVNEERAAANNRLTAIRLTMLTMRCMERWRANVSDYDKAMILVAVVAITAERFTRSGLDEALKTLDQPLPAETLAPCNVSSIAAATGLNRETARRKVKALIDEGFLVRSEQGVIGFTPGHFQQDYISELIRAQLDSLVRTANDLIRDGTLDTQR